MIKTLSKEPTDIDLAPEMALRFDALLSLIEAFMESASQNGEQSSALIQAVLAETSHAINAGELKWHQDFDFALGGAIAFNKETQKQELHLIIYRPDMEEGNAFPVAEVLSADESKLDLRFLTTQTKGSFSVGGTCSVAVFDENGKLNLFQTAVRILENMSDDERKSCLLKCLPFVKAAQKENRLPRGNGMILAVVEMTNGSVWMGVHITNCNKPITKQAFPVAPFGFSYTDSQGNTQSYDPGPMLKEMSSHTKHGITAPAVNGITTSGKSSRFFQ